MYDCDPEDEAEDEAEFEVEVEVIIEVENSTAGAGAREIGCVGGRGIGDGTGEGNILKVFIALLRTSQ
jgi:hypothetical protein